MKTNSGTPLDRRNFIKTGSAGLAGVALLPRFESTKAVSDGTSSQRRIFPLNHNWLYSDKLQPNGTKPAFNDRAFERVTIPHTNKMLPWHGFDDREFQFVSLYRRHFQLPVNLRGLRVFIDFGGVMTAATVSINGRRLGEYRGGYTPFSFELTPYLNWRSNNVLAVEVDSTERQDIPPFRWRDRLLDVRWPLSRRSLASGSRCLHRKRFCQACRCASRQPPRGCALLS